MKSRKMMEPNLILDWYFKQSLSGQLACIGVLSINLHTVPIHMFRSPGQQSESGFESKAAQVVWKEVRNRLMVPEWLHKKWKEGNHMALALELQKCNFDKDPKHVTWSYMIEIWYVFESTPSFVAYSSQSWDVVPHLTGQVHQELWEDIHRDWQQKTQDFRWLLHAWDHENQVEVEPESWIDLNML